ncbi:MAG: hypothetical protein V9G19_21865 [Tetrasphaera sp.]
MTESAAQATIRTWFIERVPDEIYSGELSVTVDAQEIVVIGEVPAESGDSNASPTERIAAHREHSRAGRIAIARDAETIFGRKVSWGARAGDTHRLYTHLGVPVMTRLRQPERLLLDTLVEGGVARSRSDALAWCVRLVGERESDWLAELHDALAGVRDARSKNPLDRADAS